MQTLMIFWSSWHLKMIVSERQHWDEMTYGRPTSKGGRSAPNLTGILLGGPLFHICGAWLVLMWFGSSGGPVDPRDSIWSVEKVLPRIDDVSLCLWAAFLLMWGYLVGHLILVCGWAFIPWTILDSFLHFLAQIYLHTFSDQHLWNLLINNPMLTFIPFDALLFHDSWRLKWVISERQQDPPHLVLCSYSSKG
jgi:hypothetical protein